jgi:hypothetical protein
MAECVEDYDCCELPRKRYGYYSRMAADISGTVWWSTPDGKQIEITAVLVDADGGGYVFPDRFLRGEVVAFVKDGRSAKPSLHRRQPLSL